MSPFNISLIGSGLTAIGMAALQIQHVSQGFTHIGETMGESLLIFAFYIGGLIIFILAGKMGEKDTHNGEIIFWLALAIRAYTFAHIYLLFEGGTFWNMIAGNFLLVSFEIALYLVSGKRDEKEAYRQKGNLYLSQVQGAKSTLIRLGYQPFEGETLPQLIERAFKAGEAERVKLPVHSVGKTERERGKFQGKDRKALTDARKYRKRILKNPDQYAPEKIQQIKAEITEINLELERV